MTLADEVGLYPVEPPTALYAETADRTPPEQRKLRRYPLSTVTMNAPVVAEDFMPGSQWPARRVRYRYDRLMLFDDLFNGDLSYFVADPSAATLLMNYFQRIPTVIAAVIMSEPPQVPEQDTRAVRMMLSDAIVNTLKYGRAYMVRIGDSLGSPDTYAVFDGWDGECYVVSSVVTPNSSDGRPDEAWIQAIWPDGSVVGRRQLWSGGGFDGLRNYGNLGEITATGDLEMGEVEYVDRLPRRCEFGTSLIEQIIPPVVEMALRFTGISSVLAAHEHPLLTIPVANADTGSALGSDGFTGDPIARADAVRSAKRMLDNDVAIEFDGAGQARYVEFTGSLPASFTMLEKLAEELSMQTGLTRALIGGTELPSGVALKRLLFVLAAESASLQANIHAAAQTVYGQEFEWPNVFEVEDVAEPEMDDAEDDGDDDMDMPEDDDA